MSASLPTRSADLIDPPSFDLLDFLPFGGSFDLPGSSTAPQLGDQEGCIEDNPQNHVKQLDENYITGAQEVKWS